MRLIKLLIWLVAIIDLVLVIAMYYKLCGYPPEYLIRRNLIGFNLYVDFGLLAALILGSLHTFEKRAFHSHYGTRLASLGDVLVPVSMLLSIFYLVVRFFPSW